MMLVIHPRGTSYFRGGMGRYYHGSGIVEEIGRGLFSRGDIKKAISSGASSAIAHKVVDAVVNGPASETSKKVANAIVKEVEAGKASANAAFDSIVNQVNKKKKKKHKPQKRPHQPSSQSAEATLPKINKIDIDRLIDGSGIVYD